VIDICDYDSLTYLVARHHERVHDGALAERYVVEEDVRGLHADQSIYEDLLGLWVIPDPTDQLLVLEDRPQDVLSDGNISDHDSNAASCR
jgi:hypothetical protein